MYIHTQLIIIIYGIMLYKLSAKTGTANIESLFLGETRDWVLANLWAQHFDQLVSTSTCFMCRMYDLVTLNSCDT